MKLGLILFASIFALAPTNSRAQSQPLLAQSLYLVDKQVDLQLKKFTAADAGVLKNSMTIKVFWDTRMFFNQSLDCFTKSILRHDTIFIFGEMIGELGYGFELALFRDSCMVASFGISDGKIYKYNKSDRDSISLIPLPSTTHKVILSKKPSFQKGDIVAGKVEVKSVPFYYTQLEGVFRIELVAYFKTAPVEEMQ
jgi:hypothetical protein